MSDLNVWRAEYLTPWGDEPLHCRKDRTHRPPEPDCTCGIYGVEKIADLVNHLKAAEFRQAYNYLHPTYWVPAAATGSMRLAVKYGRLTSAVPVPPCIPELAGEMAARIEYQPARVTRLAVHGDPPGTWRGQTFTTKLAVVQTQEGDNLEGDQADSYSNHGLAWYKARLPAEHHFVTQRGTDDLLSFVLTRHIASGRTNQQWWTA